MEQSHDISMPAKISFWLAAWLIAGVGFVAAWPIIIWPALLHWSWFFPVGLFSPFVGRETPDQLAFTLTGIGWLIYIALTICGLSQRRRTNYFLFYVILCALLVFNAVGCRMSLEGIGKS